MAEIDPRSHNSHKGPKQKKLSTKVDLTPMVDLGFLLITFFVFTTSLSRPNAMKINMPAGDVKSTPEGESAVLTVIPLSGNRVFYYERTVNDAISRNLYGVTSFALQNGIGDIIRRKQLMLTKSGRFGSDDLFLLIKPAAECRYENVVKLLDEALINNVRHYALLTEEPDEKNALFMLGVK